MSAEKQICQKEIEYLSQVILKDHLGLELDFTVEDNDIKIVLKNGRKLIFKETFFLKFKKPNEYMSISNIPRSVKWFKNQFTDDEAVPVIFGSGEIIEENGNLICYADIPASAFFMLTRWEESVVGKVDEHKRFSAKDSLAFKERFIDKPVVDIYSEIIWKMLLHLGLEKNKKVHQFEIEPSHDVDNPLFYHFSPLNKIAKSLAKDIIRKKDVALFISNLAKLYKVKTGNIKADPFYTFDYIMQKSEELGLKSTFYFLSGVSEKKYDGHYLLENKVIKTLAFEILNRGHDIGLHGSYNTIFDQAAASEEFEKLKNLYGRLGFNSKKWSSRQHYLRFSVPETFQILENTGLNYDSTLTYADCIGFRTGTCRKFRVFNFKTRKMLNLIEKPLLVMDATLMFPKYMGLGFGQEALEKALKIKSECRKYNGIFSVLWHNSELDTSEKRELYSGILEG